MSYVAFAECDIFNSSVSDTEFVDNTIYMTSNNCIYIVDTNTTIVGYNKTFTFKQINAEINQSIFDSERNLTCHANIPSLYNKNLANNETDFNPLRNTLHKCADSVINITNNITINTTIILNTTTNVENITNIMNTSYTPVIIQNVTYDHLDQNIEVGSCWESQERNIKACAIAPSLRNIIPPLPERMQNCTAPIVAWQCPNELVDAGCSEADARNVDFPACSNTLRTTYNETLNVCRRESGEFSRQFNETSRLLTDKSNGLVLCEAKSNDIFSYLLAIGFLVAVVILITKFSKIKPIDVGKKILTNEKNSDMEKEYLNLKK